MLQYLIILLDDTSVSYCHYDVPQKERRLIGLDTLKRGIVFAMKENLNIQFVYPDYELPAEYTEAIESIDHTKIKPQNKSEKADVVVLTNWMVADSHELDAGISYIIRCNRVDLLNGLNKIASILSKVARLNLVLMDVAEFKDGDKEEYQEILDKLSTLLIDLYQKGHAVQLNLLTDRIMLSLMNNCNAGDVTVTLAPNGKFYLCPAFYYDNPSDDAGNIDAGLCIKNQQLLNLSHAPICRHCDAYQCKRCVWMNQKLTMDINTPSHQQCVAAHLERNASMVLATSLKGKGIRLANGQEIKEINYLDPFENYKQWK